MTNIPPGTGARADAKAVPLHFFGKFAVLKNAIPELWIIFAVKLVSSAAYQLTNLTLVLWLESDFRFNDKQALAWVAAWSLLMTVATLLVGSLTDALGMRRTLFLGTGLCLVTRSVMAFVTLKWLSVAAGLLPLAIGEALANPVLVAAVRRYSDTRQRSISFSIVYTMMNAGFLIAAWLFDDIRQWLGEYGHLNLSILSISTYRALFLASLVLEILLLPLIYMLREGAEASDEGLKLAAPAPKYPGRNLLQRIGLTARQAFNDSVNLFVTLWRQAGFYRLLAFLVLIAFLKLIFMQMYYVYPTFGIRELGPGAPVGKLWAINSMFIIVLVPVVGGLTQRFSAYTMVILGGLISAGSVFIMAMPTEWFVSMANGWLGDLVGHWHLGLTGEVHPYYVMIALFVILLSFGEAFYSPRVYEYAAAIAPKGQEASYGALSYVPFLLAKMLIGTFSGLLLTRYCPETGPRHSQTMWLIVGLTSLIAPAGLMTLRRLIRVHEAGRD
jgi:MFS family permease